MIYLKKGLQLYDYQIEGINFIQKTNGNCLISDDMGVGKTIEALVYVYNNYSLRPVIIICPSSLKYNWYYEAKKWLDTTETICIVDKKIPKDIQNSTIIIINYDIIHKYLNFLRRLHPEVLIIDESHYIKSIYAKRTKATMLLSRNIPHKLLLSGTPILNNITEIWTQLNIINPVEWNNYLDFINSYCTIEQKNGVEYCIGIKNKEEFHTKLSKLMLRRTKQEVLKQLPSKTRSTIFLPITNRKEYEQLEKETKHMISYAKNKNMSNQKLRIFAFARIEYLKQCASKGKLPYIKEYIDLCLQTGNKTVIFASHHNIINTLYKIYNHIAVKVTGEDKIKDRNRSVQRFQTDPKCKLFIGSIYTANLGITLTSGNICLIIELGWNPATMIQAEDRLHRVGQTNPVDIYYLIAKDTIEEKISNIIDTKSDSINNSIQKSISEKYKIIDNIIESI